MGEDFILNQDENRSQLAADGGYDIGTFHFLTITLQVGLARLPFFCTLIGDQRKHQRH